MARQKKYESATKVSFNVPNDVLERLDRLAEIGQLDRTRLIINILDEFSGVLELSGKVGVLQASVLIRNMAEYLNNFWVKKIKTTKIELL